MSRFILALAALALAAFTQVPRGVDDPRAFVQGVYTQYRRGDAPRVDLDIYGSERLVALVHAFDEAAGGEQLIDFDWWVNGQDWRLSDIRITQIEGGSGRRIVTVRFANMGRVSVNRFDFVRAHGRWFLDEVVNESGGGGWTLSALLGRRP